VEPRHEYKGCFVVAAVDFILATICAAYGNSYFVYFMILAGIMWAFGLYFKAKADKEIGE
jgi:hypothetical protein